MWMSLAPASGACGHLCGYGAKLGPSLAAAGWVAASALPPTCPPHASMLMSMRVPLPGTNQEVVHCTHFMRPSMHGTSMRKLGCPLPPARPHPGGLHKPVLHVRLWCAPRRAVMRCALWCGCCVRPRPSTPQLLTTHPSIGAAAAAL